MIQFHDISLNEVYSDTQKRATKEQCAHVRASRTAPYCFQGLLDAKYDMKRRIGRTHMLATLRLLSDLRGET